MKISVVSPSYSQLDYIKLCAASVADQECDFEFEHLIEDACSGDDFDQWAKGQPFASVRSQPDKGMYDAINNGFERAQGEILAWLNCDEQYLPGTLQKVADWFDANPDKEVLFGDVVLVDDRGTPISYRSGLVPWAGHVRHCFLPTYSAAMFVRRNVIEKVGQLDTQYREIADAVWVLKFLEKGVKCGVLNEPLATFLQNGENMGQQAAGLTESQLWRSKILGDNRGRRFIWLLLHRLGKLWHGEYRKKEVAICIYDPDTGERETKTAKVNGKWVQKM